jgi:hypothetical protein
MLSNDKIFPYLTREEFRVNITIVPLNEGEDSDN